jgi:hypothetical protein
MEEEGPFTKHVKNQNGHKTPQNRAVHGSTENSIRHHGSGPSVKLFPGPSQHHPRCRTHLCHMRMRPGSWYTTTGATRPLAAAAAASSRFRDRSCRGGEDRGVMAGCNSDSCACQSRTTNQAVTARCSTQAGIMPSIGPLLNHCLQPVKLFHQCCSTEGGRMGSVLGTMYIICRGIV